MERLEVIKKLKKACLTEKRVNWFNTRMLNLVNKLGLLDGFFFEWLSNSSFGVLQKSVLGLGFGFPLVC